MDALKVSMDWFRSIKIGVVGLVLLLNGCVTQSAHRHTPQYIDHIPYRAAFLVAQTQDLTVRVATLALQAYNKAQAAGYGDKHILTIIDYSEPSTEHRFWVIDLDSNKVLFHELVAHGVGSGALYATRFSDQINSKETSIGLFLTAQNPYRGRHGESLHLQGLEPGFNGNVWARSIVIHAAPYVCDQFVHQHGMVGQTWGCPALNAKDVRQIINTIKGGTLLFAYANDPNWLQHSRFLN